jgi:hypothetical protein
MRLEVAMKTMLAFWALAACPVWSLAEDEHSVETPEAFQAVCDQAMPALLQGKLPDVLSKVASEQDVKDFADRFRKQFEPVRADLGEPLGSSYVGVRKRGATLRQYVYLCRYSETVVVWRLTAVRNEGRWSLAGCTFDQQLSLLFLQTAPEAADAESGGEKLADKIVDALVRGRSEALDLLKAGSLSNASSNGMRREAEQAIASIVLAGGSLTNENVDTKSAGGVLTDRSYLVRCKRGAMCIQILLYRPNSDWKVLGLHFHPASSLEDLLGGAPLERSGGPNDATDAPRAKAATSESGNR